MTELLGQTVGRWALSRPLVGSVDLNHKDVASTHSK